MELASPEHNDTRRSYRCRVKWRVNDNAGIELEENGCWSGESNSTDLGTTDQRQASSVMFQSRISAGLVPLRKLNATKRPDAMELLIRLHNFTRRCILNLRAIDRWNIWSRNNDLRIEQLNLAMLVLFPHMLRSAKRDDKLLMDWGNIALLVASPWALHCSFLVNLVPIGIIFIVDSCVVDCFSLGRGLNCIRTSIQWSLWKNWEEWNFCSEGDDKLLIDWGDCMPSLPIHLYLHLSGYDSVHRVIILLIHSSNI